MDILPELFRRRLGGLTPHDFQRLAQRQPGRQKIAHLTGKAFNILAGQPSRHAIRAFVFGRFFLNMRGIEPPHKQFVNRRFTGHRHQRVRDNVTFFINRFVNKYRHEGGPYSSYFRRSSLVTRKTSSIVV